MNANPGSAVFTPPAAPTRDFNSWWTYLPGASNVGFRLVYDKAPEAAQP